jgi:hypothetical protein
LWGASGKSRSISLRHCTADKSKVMQAIQLSPELSQRLLQLARALLAAARNCTFYPPEHPAVTQSTARLAAAVAHAASEGGLTVGITPETLLVEGASADRRDSAIGDAARYLHDRDIIQLTFAGEPPASALTAFLLLLALDTDELRSRGGPSAIWAVEGHPSIAIDQVDYRKVLEREHGEHVSSAPRDDVWRSIVTSISNGLNVGFDPATEERLLLIAGSVSDIADLATAAMAPKCSMDGSPMITSQAATVLAAFRHLTNIVSLKSPDRMPLLMANLASATAQFDPRVIMQVIEHEAGAGDGGLVVREMSATFDDGTVAQLLATALALDGQASERLATILNTIVPDEERKQRVVSMTRTLLSETDFGRSNQFQALWASMEELLISYNDRPFVSEAYRTALDEVGGRAERLAATDLPQELDGWMDTLGQDNIRTLSVTLLIDLLRIEEAETRAFDIAQDMAARAEDLLMAGAYADATAVVGVLAERARAAGAVGRDGCRQALDRLGGSIASRETAALLGELDESTWKSVRALFVLIGPGSIDALKTAIAVERPGVGSDRAGELIVQFGAQAVSRLSTLVADASWVAQCAAAHLLGRIGAASAVPLLQPLVRSKDPRVAAAAIAALGGIDDPAAARAMHIVLRGATGDRRHVMVEALVRERDPRVVPMLVRILGESEILGADHDVALETLDALKLLASEQAVPAIVKTIACRGFFKKKKQRAIKVHGVDALAAIGGSKATTALGELAKTGDRLLRQIVTERRNGSA